MAGELDVAIAGQRATILFLNDDVVFRFANFFSARQISKQSVPNPGSIGRFLDAGGISLKGQIGSGKPFELFPRPSFIIRWLSPTLRNLLSEVSR
jgi:hypothetical protein